MLSKTWLLSNLWFVILEAPVLPTVPLPLPLSFQKTLQYWVPVVDVVVENEMEQFRV